MAIYRQTLRRNIGRGTQRSPFTAHMNVTLEIDQLNRIRELANRNGLSAASIIRELIDEALRARVRRSKKALGFSIRREDDARPDLAARRDGQRRSPAEGSEARIRATMRRCDNSLRD